MKFIFNYESDTGCLVWKHNPNLDHRWNSRYPGKLAGSNRFPKPSQVFILGRLYFVHKVVWLYHKGYWPDYIDHIDTDNYNNRIENLREATHQQNMGNRANPDRGVDFDHGRWRARIGFNYERIMLGYFNSPEEAQQAYNKASIKLWGEFSSVKEA